MKEICNICGERLDHNEKNICSNCLIEKKENKQLKDNRRESRRGYVWISRRNTWVPIAIAKREGLLKKRKKIKSNIWKQAGFK